MGAMCSCAGRLQRVDGCSDVAGSSSSSSGSNGWLGRVLQAVDGQANLGACALRHDQDVAGGGAEQVPHCAALPVWQPAAV
jgi:hypothetical protein